jgi:putative YphP/YqiW family bacilliredoxin
MLMSEYPSYDPVAVEPMRQELREVGFRDLLTPAEVDREFDTEQGTLLVVLNSVCGCAAGNARPGVALALQNDRVPDRLCALFAGMEKAAVARFRERMEPMPPSSPCMVLIRQGEPVAILHRMDIENRTAEQVAGLLVQAFNDNCDAVGPSIPAEAFAQLSYIKRCGSKVPRFES